MKVIELTPDEMAQSSIISSMVGHDRKPFATYATPVDDEDQKASYEEFWDGFRRDNTAAGAYRLAEKVLTGGVDPKDVDPDFNPYGYIDKSWDKDRQERLAMLIDNGYFDGALTPESVEAHATRAEEELDMNQGASTGWGIAGSVAGGILDPINLVPVAGWATKGRTVYRMAKLAATTALTQAANEAVLQSEQEYRTLSESITNIGVAAALGGGLGVFGGAGLKAHKLNPSNVENPLLPHNISEQGMTVRGIGSDAVDHIEPGHLSAAAAPKVDLSRVGEGTKLGNAISLIGKRVKAVTPIGRLTYSLSPIARSAMVKLADTGGVLWNMNRFGKTTGRSAEDLRAFYEVKTREHVSKVGSETLIETNKQLGKFGKKIAPHEFMESVQRFLVNTHIQEDTDNLVQKLGPDSAQVVESKARELTEEIHRVNDQVEK